MQTLLLKNSAETPGNWSFGNAIDNISDHWKGLSFLDRAATIGGLASTGFGLYNLFQPSDKKNIFTTLLPLALGAGGIGYGLSNDPATGNKNLLNIFNNLKFMSGFSKQNPNTVTTSPPPLQNTTSSVSKPKVTLPPQTSSTVVPKQVSLEEAKNHDYLKKYFNSDGSINTNVISNSSDQDLLASLSYLNDDAKNQIKTQIQNYKPSWYESILAKSTIESKKQHLMKLVDQAMSKKASDDGFLYLLDFVEKQAFAENYFNAKFKLENPKGSYKKFRDSSVDSLKDYPIEGVTYPVDYGSIADYLGEDESDLDVFKGSGKEHGLMYVNRPDVNGGVETKVLFNVTKDEKNQIKDLFKKVLHKDIEDSDYQTLLHKIEKFRKLNDIEKKAEESDEILQTKKKNKRSLKLSDVISALGILALAGGAGYAGYRAFSGSGKTPKDNQNNNQSNNTQNNTAPLGGQSPFADGAAGGLRHKPDFVDLGVIGNNLKKLIPDFGKPDSESTATLKSDITRIPASLSSAPLYSLVDAHNENPIEWQYYKPQKLQLGSISGGLGQGLYELKTDQAKVQEKGLGLIGGGIVNDEVLSKLPKPKLQLGSISGGLGQGLYKLKTDQAKVQEKGLGLIGGGIVNDEVLSKLPNLAGKQEDLEEFEHRVPMSPTIDLDTPEENIRIPEPETLFQLKPKKPMSPTTDLDTPKENIRIPEPETLFQLKPKSR